MNLSRRQVLLRSTIALAALRHAKLNALTSALEATGLKDAFQDDFLVGTAIGTDLIDNLKPDYLALITREFNAITLENEMKWERVHPEPNAWQWDHADWFVEFGTANDMYLLGHVLVWHSQTPDWVFQDDREKPIRAAALRMRMREHIQQLVGRYKGKVHAWDAVNEAVDEDKGWRKSPWFNILGPQFVEEAFVIAHEVDPKAQLLYNDYNMHNPGKRRFVVDFVEDFKRRGVPIHGIGMQGHVGLDSPDLNEFEASIKAYAATGLPVHITELDVDVLPVAWEHFGAEISADFEYSDELNPFPKFLPLKVEQQLTARYVELFKLFLKYRDSIARVTFWGTGDGESWKNNFPVRGRTNYPLLFDRDYYPKPAYFAVKQLKGTSKN